MFDSINLSTLLYNLGRLSGVIGLLFLAILIFSGDTARYFDRFFGLDRIIKFQRKFAFITLIFILLHPTFFILSGIPILGVIIPNFSVIPLSLGILAFYAFIASMISSILYKRISYIAWQYIHILNYVIVFFGLYHALNWGSSIYTYPIKTLYEILFFGIIIGIIYRTQYKIRHIFKQKFFVENVKEETKDTFTLTLKSNNKFKFKAGQFCFLRVNKNDLNARHPFTISSAPQENNIQFTIKHYGGRFTETASKLEKGEEVLIDGPFGIFTTENKKNHLVFIAGGVGVTPFISMIKERVANNYQQKITLLYGSHSSNDIIFKNYLDNIKNDWFKKIYVLSKDKSGDQNHENGYINKDTITKYIKDIDNATFYICGPKAMKDSIKEDLKKLDVKNKNIIIEDFFW